ncbi:MAG TPA: hypothetical protein VNL95_01325 [Dehalococcoidia bacterium]|nr:hypothetical protein [Dehalococcoidia bacterium]
MQDLNWKERQDLLLVKLHENKLSLGEMGELFRNLQVAVRGAATVLDKPPPNKSVVAGNFREGSLEFAIQVIGWSPDLVVAVGDTLVDLLTPSPDALDWARELLMVLTGFGPLMRKLILVLRRRLARNVQDDWRRLLERELQRPSSPRKDELIAEMAERLGADYQTVAAAVKVVEAMDRNRRLLVVAGGATISAPASKRTVHVPNSRQVGGF